MAPNGQVCFREKLNSNWEVRVKVDVLMNGLDGEDRYMDISYMAVSSEVAWEADLFEKTVFEK